MVLFPEPVTPMRRSIILGVRKSGAPSFAHSAGQVQQSFVKWSTLRALAAGCKMDLRRDTSGEPLNIAKTTAKKAGLLYFVFVMFAYTTGGPFGMEGMVTTSGPGVTLLYLLVIPLFWCIPVSLVAAELTTAIPVEGGFYRWVRAGFGDFWGFLAGWWNWSASFLLGGTYGVLTADYLTFFFPG